MSTKAGGRKCCVPGCKSSSYRAANRNVTFSAFPRDEALRQQWINLIKENTNDVENPNVKRLWGTPRRAVIGSKHQTVCGYHFSVTGRRSYGQNLPKLFYHKMYQEDLTLLPESFCEVANFIEFPNLNRVNLPQHFNKLETNSNIEEATEHGYSLNKDFDHLSKRVKSQRSTIDLLITMVENMSALTQENIQLKKKINEMEIQKKTLLNENTELKLLKGRLSTLEKENQDLHEQLEFQEKKPQASRFSLDQISTSSMLKFYTGFEDMDDLDDLYKYLEPELSSLTFYNSSRGYDRKTARNDGGNKGRPMVLDYKDQLFLVLCRLKVGLFEEDLAYRFSVSVSTVSNICITWFDLLEKRLTQLKIWPSRKIIDEHMPEEFKKF